MNVLLSLPIYMTVTRQWSCAENLANSTKFSDRHERTARDQSQIRRSPSLSI